MIDISGKVALVTGSSRGIGRASAVRLAEAGADIVINYLSSRRAAESLADQIAELNRRVRVLVVKADVSARDDIEAMMESVGDHFGHLDIVVSNAASGGFRRLMDATDRHFTATLETNTRPLMHLVQAAMPLFRHNTARTKVIALSSHGSHRALPEYGLIGASKAALESLARHLAFELGDDGINVNVVQAGLVETDSTRMIPNAEAMFAAATQRSFVGDRRLSPEDVANVVLYLASPLSDMVQGQTIIVDGGAAICA